ncbi:MAG TPA: hypothetical protein VG104_01950 [Candidatus Dormibacteraeota bacterium]|nr:hypothetical protein [Candidatus Dormibacteraeota bacterium]
MTRRWPAASIALAIYAVLAVEVFASTWVNPAERWIGSPKDPQLFIWYLGWIPHQLSQGLNPLFTDHLSYPPGVNLMWNTSMLFPAVLLWPVTAAFGPVVAYNMLITGGIALSAWCGFLAARRFVDRDLACFLAGLLYGFSPGMLAQALGHPHVVVALFPPVALLLGHEILVRRRLNPVVAGALAGVAAALQLLTGEEVLAATLVIGVFGVALLALMHRDQLRTSLPYVAKASGAALFVFAILAAYPLGFQFLGPQRVSGSVQGPDVYVSDLLAFFLPGNLIHFTGNVTENDAYVGLPLLALFAAGLVLGWHAPRIRWIGLTALVVAVLSLGPHLHVDGNVTPVLLPWALVAQLPLMESALPARLMDIGFLGIGIVVAYACARALSSTRGWQYVTAVLLLLGAVIVPPLPYPSVAATAPPFFKSGGDVERIQEGSIVLVTPFSSKESTDAMFWQATAGYRFRMPEGDAFTPGPYLGPHPSFLESALDRLDAGQTFAVTPDVRAMALADLTSFGVTTIVSGPSPGQPAIVEFLTEVEGRQPVDDGGVKVWWTVSP